MTDIVRFDQVEFGWVPASSMKSWSFAQIRDADGMSIVVELQNTKPDSPRATFFAELIGRLRGLPVEHDSQVGELLGITAGQAGADPDISRTLSALSTAVIEFQCQYQGVNMTAALGGTPKRRQQLYANVNRFLSHTARARAPRDFAAAAERAATQGFTIIKVDPFDEVVRGRPVEETVALAQTGFARLTVMGEAAGPDVALLVDCHGAFSLEAMPVVAARLEELGVTWLEDPLHHRPKAEGLRKLLPTVDLPLVSGGDDYGEASFRELIEVGGVAIIMQDVMRCGGAGVAARVGQWAARRGVRTSCHSPFGPLSNLASAHVHAASPDSYALEHAVWENEWRAELIEPPERVEEGHLCFPGGTGMGATLNWQTLERVGGKRWTA
jgi:galactonate dehydratase